MLSFAFENPCDARYDVPMLRDLVVLKPQWVIDHIVEIIRDQELHTRRDKTSVLFLRNHQEQVDHLYECAILNGTLLEGFWPDLESTEREQLALLMERFGLLVRVHGDRSGPPKWLVPPLLENCKSSVEVPPEATSVFYVYFDIPTAYNCTPVMHQKRMTRGFLPNGFFHRLLGVATAYMQETLPYGVDKFWDPDLTKDCGHLYVLPSRGVAVYL
jgi:hypothetical protein